MNRNAIRTVALALPVLGALLAGGSGAALAAGEAGGAAAAAPLLLLAQADPGPPPPRAIREAQALLADLGYDPGPADGKWGRRTGEAYQAFLRDAGWPPAERLTPEALRAMRAAAKRGSVPASAAAREAQREPSRGALPPEVLHRAAQAGDIGGLEAALSSGADLDRRDGSGWTALMHAVNKGYTLLVEPLLEAGADPDVRAPDGATALFMAAVHGHTEVIELLMEAGADVSVKGPKGMTAADVARALYGDAEAAKENDEPPAVIALLEGRTLLHDCDECPVLVVVPSGSFEMGSPDSARRVSIANPFAVGVYEVTFDEWDACVAEGGCDGYRPDDKGWGRGNRPVINVSWKDAKAYVRWLSGETGEDYRLLSEAEWEYVARAGTTGPFHTGATISTEQANYNGNYGKKTVPVGEFPANGFGLYDVHGNVREWVEDCSESYFSGNCRVRVMRGGSWVSSPSDLRSYKRFSNSIGDRYNYAGFRVARTLAP